MWRSEATLHAMRISLFIAFECDYFQVRPPFISQLKTIRQLAVTRLKEFFENLIDFDVKPICDAVFSYAVWPQVKSKVFLSLFSSIALRFAQLVWHYTTVCMDLNKKKFRIFFWASCFLGQKCCSHKPEWFATISIVLSSGFIKLWNPFKLQSIALWYLYKLTVTCFLLLLDRESLSGGHSKPNSVVEVAVYLVKAPSLPPFAVKEITWKAGSVNHVLCLGLPAFFKDFTCYACHGDWDDR